MSESRHKPKAVVLVDALSSGLGMREEAKRQGYKTIGYVSQPPQFWRDMPKPFMPDYMKPNADPSLFDYIIKETNLRAGLQKLKALNVEIKAVIAGAEPGVMAADFMANELGLPGNDYYLSNARRDKSEMKDAVNRAGLRTARYKRCYSVKDLDDFLTSEKYPIVLKPPSGCGTYKVFISHLSDKNLKGTQRLVKLFRITNSFTDGGFPCLILPQS
ncbi:MAG: hypothetical protein NTW04_01505 [Elusimicrobia bacterium]|nr:hypothetical protein [Elusimicrobiota bacterium]